ncbi:histidine kinase [Bacillus manliponensis]|uniref:histidine kinase n=1 Tax=Bacillus manliponensis TaxID=574376 RepID=A0A073JV26_9BACI|nr:HAMP domain-containing sensor histidine kinase [Bacillus manliponensis]KEK18087.1 histidine kinase [Bacillus manliponensis]
MNKLSLKLGTCFLLLALCIEIVAFMSIHTTLSKMRIEEETTALLTKGNWYRDFLERRPSKRAMEHITAMESHSPADTKLVITNPLGEVIAYSDPITSEMQKHLSHKVDNISKEGIVSERHWQTSKYISTISPITIDGKVTGYVHMFLDTSFLKKMITRLTEQFIIVGVLIIALTTVSVFVLSRVITTPLVQMKRATEKMLQRNKPITLNIKRNDELGSLAKTIERLSNELTYMKKERNEFLASVAHELLTPLTYMKGYAKVAKRETLSREEREEYLQIIEDETESITKLVQDLFDLVQLEQHQFVIKKECVLLYPFLEKIIEKTKPAFHQKQITLSLQCEQDFQTSIDTIRMEQVILNLIQNAYQHSPSHSHITIKVIKLEHTFTVEIQDEGDGIPPEDLPHIFERFYRVDKSRTRATGGKGIGLAVVKEIIELHKGTIHVRSHFGAGTTFIITLPVQ